MTRYLIVLAIIWTLGGCFFSPDPDGGLTDLGEPRDMGWADLREPRDGSVNPDLACGPGSCSLGCCQNGRCQEGKQPINCGIGGQACQECMIPFQACLSNQSCGRDPNEVWQFTVESATISPTKLDGQSWDPGLNNESNPDPYVTVGTFQTKMKRNTLSPIWNETFPFKLSDLMTGVLVSVWDADTGTDEIIAGPDMLKVEEKDLMAGTIKLTGGNPLKSINFALGRQ